MWVIALKWLRVRTGDAMRLRNECTRASQSSNGDELVIDGYAGVGELQDVDASRAPLCSSEQMLISLHRSVKGVKGVDEHTLLYGSTLGDLQIGQSALGLV